MPHDDRQNQEVVEVLEAMDGCPEIKSRRIRKGEISQESAPVELYDRDQRVKVYGRPGALAHSSI